MFTSFDRLRAVALSQRSESTEAGFGIGGKRTTPRQRLSLWETYSGGDPTGTYQQGRGVLRYTPTVDLSGPGRPSHQWLWRACRHNGPEATPNSVASLVELQWGYGVGALCPTIVTAAPGAMLASLRCVIESCRESPIERSVLGIHLEGPYISAVDGPRGAHPLEHVRPPDWDEFCGFQEAAEGRIRLVTLAPEVEGAIPFIERLVKQQIVVSPGHTNAETRDIAEATRAGARLSTHLGNGAHFSLQRHPNYIWDQLANDGLMASFIVDGHHLPPSVVKSVVRGKETHRTILISDAVVMAGLPPGFYPVGSQTIEVGPEGRISLAGTPYLFGAGASIEQGVANVVRFAETSLPEAIHMASLHPARLLSREGELGTLEPGKKANIIVFEWTETGIQVHQTVVEGQVVSDAGV